MGLTRSAAGSYVARAIVTLVVAAGIIVIGATAALAASITSAGPLTRVEITDTLNCAVDHVGDAAPEFFDDTACGTLLAVDGTLYGPPNIPAGNAASPRTAFTPVSQSAVTGSGTSGDPFTIVTVVALGTSGLQLTETDTYVVGEESYRTDVTVTNTGTTPRTATLYRAGDCFLQNSDRGFGAADAATGAVSCVAGIIDSSGNLVPGSRIEQWFPLSSGSHYYEDGFFNVWAKIGSQQPFADSCAQCANYIDNGAGLSWDVTIPASGVATRSHLTVFSPLGRVPLTTSKVADSSTSNAGGSNGYTITIHNPNTTAVSLSDMTDTLPAGFTYTAGSSSGATTADPSIAGQDLTWAGPFSVGPSGDISIHFNVTVSSTPGDYFNNAGGDASGFTVAPSGDTAKVTVASQPWTLTVTKAGSGSGTVTSSPAGIDCGTTCSSSFPNGTMVTLTATADAGSTFTGWAGDCSGTGPCVVTMDQDRTVTATFDIAARSPREMKQDAVASLQALLPTGDQDADRKIHRSIHEITETLEPQLWVDESHLTDRGRRVFHEEKEAARALEHVADPNVDVSSALDLLVAADETLARTAIDEATAAGGDPTKLARAEREMDKAADQVAMGHFAKAIGHYGKAWKKASQSLM
jgi:uncharacterized repeat protein (TIGR01451 family)/uncharacterized repeat protein (TIGR02543 family)